MKEIKRNHKNDSGKPTEVRQQRAKATKIRRNSNTHTLCVMDYLATSTQRGTCGFKIFNSVDF